MMPYPPELEDAMRSFHRSLNEKDQRLYAGVEALKLGHGGRGYIARLLGCSRNTVSKGAAEVSGLSQAEVHGKLCDEKSPSRIRQPGGGRKPYQEKWGPELDERFLEVLRDHTAGDPMDETVRWTNLTPARIVTLLAEGHHLRVSRTVVQKLLKKHHYRRRKAQKKSP